MSNLAVANQPGQSRVDVFVIQQDHSVAHWPRFDGAPGWDQLGGWVSSIDATWFDGDQNLMVVGVGTDGTLWYRSYATAVGTWNAWAPYAPLSPPLPAVTILT